MNKSKTTQKVPFTLTELLIVMAILAILVSLLSPALRDALVTTRKLACISNQKTLVQAILSYANEHDDYFPVLGAPTGTNPRGWDYSIFEYTEYRTSFYTCPGQTFPNANQRGFTLGGQTFGAQLSYTINGLNGLARATGGLYPVDSEISTKVSLIKPDTFLLLDNMRQDSYSCFGLGAYKDIRHITLSNHDMKYCTISSVDGSAQSYFLTDMLGKDEFGRPSLVNDVMTIQRITAARFNGAQNR